MFIHICCEVTSRLLHFVLFISHRIHFVLTSNLQYHVIWYFPFAFDSKFKHLIQQHNHTNKCTHFICSFLSCSRVLYVSIFYSQLVRLFLFIRRSHHIAHKVLFCHFCSFFIFAIRSLTLALSNIFTP